MPPLVYQKGYNLYNLLYMHSGSDPKGWVGVGPLKDQYQDLRPFCFEPRSDNLSVVKLLPYPNVGQNGQIRSGDQVIISLKDANTGKELYIQYQDQTFKTDHGLSVSTNNFTPILSQATPLYIHSTTKQKDITEGTVVYFTPTSNSNPNYSTLVTDYNGSYLCTQKKRPHPNGYWKFLAIPTSPPAPHPPAPTPHPPAPTPHPPAPTPHPPAPTPHPPAPHPPAPTPHPPAPHPPAPTPHQKEKINWTLLGALGGGLFVLIILIVLVGRK